jgi:uncharacterized protein YerC
MDSRTQLDAYRAYLDRVQKGVGELAAAQSAYAEAEARLDRLRSARDLLVREKLREGWTYQQVSDATGFSRGRVGQIARA